MKRFFYPLLATGLALGLLAPQTVEAVPAQMQIQGVLQDSLGGVSNASSVQLTVRVHDAETGGNVLHTEVADVSLVRGHFQFTLGRNTPLDLSNFDGDQRWVSVQVMPDMTELEPRIAIGYLANAALAGNTNSVPWSGVTDVPPHVASAGGYTSGIGMRVDNGSRTFGLQHTGCAAGSMWVRTADTAQWVCQPVASSLTAGFGISISGRQVGIDTTIIQRRANNHDCPYGIRVLNAFGGVICATNNDTDTNVYGRLCTDVGTILRGYTAEGQPICVPDQNTNVFGTACTGSNEYLQGFNVSGQPICVTSSFVDTNVFGRQCSILGQVVQSFGATGIANCTTTGDTDTNVFGQECPSGQLLRGFNSTGAPICVADRNTNSSYYAGGGISLNASQQFSVVSNTFVPQSCTWRNCGNSNDCACQTDMYMRAFHEGGDDWVYCCQLVLPY